MPQKLIILAKRADGTGWEAPITVHLPMNERAMEQVNVQLRELHPLLLDEDDMLAFRKGLEYLPVTEVEVIRADAIYKTTGKDWHTACKLARQKSDHGSGTDSRDKGREAG